MHQFTSKNQLARSIGLCLSLLVLWPSAASADAVTLWNENAAKAATAACIHISGNGLAESRMYAMVHVAVHDAVNAIEEAARTTGRAAHLRAEADVGSRRVGQPVDG